MKDSREPLTNKVVRDFTKEAFERFMRLMPSGDLTLVILKGHLLVEEQMDKFIDASLGDAASAFSSLNLPFKRKWTFAKQLHEPPSLFSKVWKEVDELNKLRNLIAHDPEVPDLDARCAAFVEQTNPEPPASIAPDGPSRLAFAIGNLVASIAGMRLGREIRKKAGEIAVRCENV